MKQRDLTYEEAVNKLDEILRDLEKDNCSLDESIDKFKKGMELYNYCSNLLSKAEGEVKLLLKDDFDKIEEIDFPMEGNDDFL